ncbi:MAG TPA: hypothetical protein VD973_24610 [Symbiobacteriaceae bacterium]|jgi:tetratricopeptide (TPR) repeat protein|nr:hypothetical protein [Symbiobacteriaceae bacterium]
MSAWVESVEYQQAMNACRTNNRAALDRIIEERLATVNGPERAFWLSIRAGRRAKDAVLPDLLEFAWADLEEAHRAAPDDLAASAMALSAAFRIAVHGEMADRAVKYLIPLRHVHARAPVPFFWQDMGQLNMKRGRWHKAVQAFDRALTLYQSLDDYERTLHECRPPHFHAWRGISLANLGLVEQARQDVDRAFALSAELPAQNINHLALGTGRAEVALAAGLLQEARTALQQGLMNHSLHKRPRATPAQLAETEFLAARIARAEGNVVGFDSFCEKALKICRQHRLVMTEAKVRAAQDIVHAS